MDRHSFNDICISLADVVAHHLPQLALWDEFDATVLSEGLNDSVESVLRGVADNLTPENFKKEGELIHPYKELHWDRQERTHVELLEQLGHLDQVGKFLFQKLYSQDF